MPLSTPAPRQPIHARDILCRGYRRDDGLWDIEGWLSDTKAYGFDTDERGTINPGDRIHGMWLRLTLDDDFTVRGVEAVTDDSPYRGCPAVTPNFQRLLGLTVGAGWNRAVKERLSGVHGCTHLVEMLGPLATVAFQTIYPILVREQQARETAEAAAGRRPPANAEPPQRPILLDTCHMLASDSEVTRRHWPDFYTGPKDVVAAAE